MHRSTIWNGLFALAVGFDAVLQKGGLGAQHLCDEPFCAILYRLRQAADLFRWHWQRPRLRHG